MIIKPEIDVVSIVLLGKFNPAIFTPAWFSWNDLISESSANNANLQISHPQITAFDTDWFKLEVKTDRFSISAAQPSFIHICDLAVRIFRDKLFHTPLTALGINKEIHYCVKNFEERMKLGRKLAPVEPWGDWGKEIENNEVPSGVTHLTMTQVKPEGASRTPNCLINVTVRPSALITNGRFGVHVATNDHYALEKENTQTATSEVISLLESNFDRSIKHSDNIVNHLMSLTEK